MTRAFRFNVVDVVVSGLVMATACGPGPLPAENPQQTLDPAPEVVPVKVEGTAPGAPAVPAATAEPAPPAVEPPIVVTNAGLQTPESVLFDAESDRYLVSNINGSPSEMDNNGFISILKPDGSVERLDFIQGGRDGVTLNAPKGLALHGGSLFVADIDTVRKFDAKSGAAQGVIAFPKATFLNDIAVDREGVMYVSDSGIRIKDGNVTPTGTDALYKVVNGKVTVLAKGTHLNKPNGVALLNGTLIAVTFGNKQLLQFDAKGNVAATVELPAGSLDGVAVLPDGQLLVTSWEKQAIYVGSLTGSWSAISEGLPSPADIGFDPGRNRVLVPLFTQHELRFIPATVPGLPANSATIPAATLTQASPPPSGTDAAVAPPAGGPSPVAK